MPNEPMPEDLLRVWQDQPVENNPILLEEIRRKAVRFEKRIKARNRREYIGAAVVLVIFSYYIVIFSNLFIRAGSVLIIAGAIFVMYQLYKRASPETLPADFGLTASLAFHRRELVRQQELLRSVWRWYLAPFVPGLLVFIIGAMPKRGPGIVLALAFQAAVFGGIWWLNRRAAERLTRQITELDNLGDQL